MRGFLPIRLSAAQCHGRGYIDLSFYPCPEYTPHAHSFLCINVRISFVCNYHLRSSCPPWHDNWQKMRIDVRIKARCVPPNVLATVLHHFERIQPIIVEKDTRTCRSRMADSGPGRGKTEEIQVQRESLTRSCYERCSGKSYILTHVSLCLFQSL